MTSTTPATPAPVTISEAQGYCVSPPTPATLPILGGAVVDSVVYEYKAAAEILTAHFGEEFKPNTLTARQFPRVWQAVKELQTQPTYEQWGVTKSGNPRLKPTGFGIRLLADWYQSVKLEAMPEGEWLKGLEGLFPLRPQDGPQDALEAEIVEDAPQEDSQVMALAAWKSGAIALATEHDDDRAAALETVATIQEIQAQQAAARTRRLREMGRKMAIQDFSVMTQAYMDELAALQRGEAEIVQEGDG